MARLHTSSPNRQKHRLVHPKPSSKPWDATLARYKQNPGDLTRRVPNIRSRASDVPSPSPRRTKTCQISDHQIFGLDNDTFYNDERPDEDDHESDLENDVDDSFFHWEDENTLFSDLLEESPEESTEHEGESLVKMLQPSFDLHGREVKKEIADTFVPTVNRVKKLYRVLDEKIDISFGKGVLVFNDACKQMEAMAIKEQDELKDAQAMTQKNIELLFLQLKEAYMRREQIWTDYDKAVDEIADPILENLKALPGRVERTIATLEKHARTLEKEESGEASAAEKKAKALLSKLS